MLHLNSKSLFVPNKNLIYYLFNKLIIQTKIYKKIHQNLINFCKNSLIYWKNTIVVVIHNCKYLIVSTIVSHDISENINIS